MSGLVVTIITRYLFSRRDNREYTQKVVTANQEIIYAVRPGISEGAIPTEDVLDSLISATALKDNVDATDLHRAATIADVLIKEEMDSSFLAASTKADFCQKLAQLRPTPAQATAAVGGSLSGLSDYRRKMVRVMSSMMGMIAALMTGVIALAMVSKEQTIDSLGRTAILIPTVIMLIVATVTTYSMWMYRFFQRKRKEGQNASSDIHEDTKMDVIHKD